VEASTNPHTEGPDPDPGRRTSDLFRQEAIDAYRRARTEGEVLRISPDWARRAYWLLLAVVGVALVFALANHVHEYATGRAMVRFTDRVDLTALTSGTCSSVEVRTGDRVTAGQLLARFYEGPEAAQLQRTERDFDLLLIELLSDPSNQQVRQSLAQLRSERNWARSRLDEQHRRAPSDGVVADVRVRAGQFVNAGDVFMTLAGEGTQATVVALLPGRYGPELKPGMDLRLELDGYPYSFQHLPITGVSSEVLGPTAARRVLGRDAAEALQLTEPVVVVQAQLDGSTFRARDAEHPYHDGMQGKAEVRVRSEPVLVALIPGLRALFEGGR
jgi:membrane fusion protein (multidrug efflux system)